MRTYYDVTLVTKSGDKVDIKKLTYSQIAQITSNVDLNTIIINKEYTKK
jgi:hypothetical protein